MKSDVYANKADIGKAQAPSIAKPESTTSPLALLKAILDNPTDFEHVSKYTTDDFMYVSLNYENPELKQVMPWAGTTAGTEGLVQTFKDVFSYWSVIAFETQDCFENVDGAAIFGHFTYRSNTLEKTVTSPLSVLARAKNGKLSFVQFMEDTFATVRSFRESGTYHIKSNPDGSEFDV